MIKKLITNGNSLFSNVNYENYPRISLYHSMFDNDVVHEIMNINNYIEMKYIHILLWFNNR